MFAVNQGRDQLKSAVKKEMVKLLSCSSAKEITLFKLVTQLIVTSVEHSSWESWQPYGTTIFIFNIKPTTTRS